MRDLIDSVLIGGCASYLPFWIWNNAGDQLVGALALIGITYIVKRIASFFKKAETEKPHL